MPKRIPLELVERLLEQWETSGDEEGFARAFAGDDDAMTAALARAFDSPASIATLGRILHRDLFEGIQRGTVADVLIEWFPPCLFSIVAPSCGAMLEAAGDALTLRLAERIERARADLAELQSRAEAGETW